MIGRILSFPRRHDVSFEQGLAAAERVLATPISERPARVRDLQLEEPETLLALCGRLRAQWETCPATVRDEAAFLYGFIESPRRPIGLFDEREYLLGEAALIAGTACRFLSRREEAKRWFDRAESAFRRTVNAVADWCRVTYQRLALRAEEREFGDILELLPPLIESFKGFEMSEDALKCRFLNAAVLKETEEYAKAAAEYRELCEEAQALGNERLLATASCNLVQIHCLLGNAEEALAESRRALPLLEAQQNRVGIAKLQWGLGYLLRAQGQHAAAIATFRVTQREFLDIGMSADAAAIQLVVADLLLDIGDEEQAAREIMSALPVIDEHKMVPEGLAALTLLRESVRQSKINRQALRELHGYFEELNS